MTNFPKLIPAFTIHVPIADPAPISPHLTFGRILPNANGAIRSHPDYPIKVDAALEHGADFIRASPPPTSASQVGNSKANGPTYVTLDVRALARNGTTGDLLYIRYTGKVDMGGAVGKVLRGEPDATTTGFGEIFTHVEFESGNLDLAVLAGKVFVGSGQIILEKGKPPMVEYKVSEVVAS